MCLYGDPPACAVVLVAGVHESGGGVRAAELQIKPWSRTKKQALVNGDLVALRRAAKKKDWAVYRQRKQQP